MTTASLMRASGDRVHVSVATRTDIEPYRRAMSRSAERIGQWNPVNPGDLVHHLGAQSDTHRTFLIRVDDDARLGDDDHGLVGSVNVSNVVQGRFMSATMGYNAFDPYVGGGYFREGLALVVGLALATPPAGMGLHRVEANVRIGNEPSAGVLRALGFRRERTIRRMLWLADGLDGPSQWRDHDSYAVTREEWPAPRYADHGAPAGVIVCGASVNVPVLVAVARELGAMPLFGVDLGAGLAMARTADVPVLWHAGDEVQAAMTRLEADGTPAHRGDDALVGRTLAPRDVVAAALALRPSLN